MKQLPVLYSFRRCPYAIRARMSLIEAQVGFELREVLLKEKPPEMLEVSAKGTVPVLLPLGHKDEVIDESLDIMLWALAGTNTEWLSGPMTLNNQLEMVANFEKTFKPLLDSYKYHNNHSEHDRSYYQLKALEIIEQLNDEMEKSSYLTCSKPRLVDVALFPFIRQYAHVDMDWFSRQNVKSVQEWLSRWLESDCFKLAMQKFRVWKADQEVTVFEVSGDRI